MSYIELKCKECDEINDIYCDGDSPLLCPDCLAVDEFEELDRCECCNKIVKDFYKSSACSKSCFNELKAEHKHFDKY